MKYRLLILVLLGTSALVLFAAMKRSSHTLTLTTYFKDAHGLRAGAPVRVAGVDVGHVISVRVRDDLRDRPAEVVMVLQTSYPLNLPSDAFVSLESAGVLGETYPEIDITNTSGQALTNGGKIRSRESSSPTASDWMECIAGIANNRGCQLEKNSKPAEQTR